MVPFAPDWVSPPGDTIGDLIEEKGWTVAETAVRVGLAEDEFGDLLAGRLAITPFLATRLALALGGSVAFWVERDRQYREKRG